MSWAVPRTSLGQLTSLRLARSLKKLFLENGQFIATMLLSLAAVCVLSSGVLANQGYPRRDSGMFLYTAQSILEGAIPYKDVWGDNKPPGVFYVDALGLFIGRGSVLGLWLVESLSLIVAVALSVRTLARAFGLSAAVFATLAWLIGLLLLFTSQNVNLTEEYALPFQFAGLWLFLECEEKGYWGRRGLALGAASAIAFLFRQNLVGVYLAIGAYLLLTRVRHQARILLADGAWVFAGWLAVIGPVLAYFAANSALRDLIDVAFMYNSIYTSAPIQQRLASMVAGFDWLSRSGLGVIAPAAWVAGVVFTAVNRRLQGDSTRLVALAVVAFPIEVALTGTSIRSYGHYYEAWLPVMAVLIAFFAKIATAQKWQRLDSVGTPQATVLYAALLFAMAGMPLYGLALKTLPNGRTTPVIASVAAYVRAATQPGDYVLVWGADPGINFLADRRSPTKFAHQFPLLTPTYVRPEMIQRFKADLEAHPPVLIVDTAAVNSDIPPFATEKRLAENWTRWGQNRLYGMTLGMEDVLADLNDEYQVRTELKQSDKAVVIYERRTDASR